MAKRGKKPKGEFSGKLSHFSTRIQPETRRSLEHEAKVSGQSISQLAERLLRDGLAERRQEAEQDKALRAICFIISEIARITIGPHVSDGKREARLYDWRSDPFFYKAFTIAVGRVLDALSPPGEIKAPEISLAEGEPDASMERWLKSFETPESRAEYTADTILRLFRNLPRVSEEERERQRKLLNENYTPALARQFYQIPDAAADLAVKPRSGEMVEIQMSLTPFSWSQK
jgi:hypothetical protein